MDFETAFNKLPDHKGGYVDDRRDSSSETKFGVSKRVHLGEDIPNMTIEWGRA